jgi:predicted DNA-binding transcriptional regulator AlpA
MPKVKKPVRDEELITRFGIMQKEQIEALASMVTTEKLRHSMHALNLKHIAVESGIPYPTIYSRIKRGTEMPRKEALAIAHTLVINGIILP